MMNEVIQLPSKNKVIKLSSIRRQVLDGQPYIVLDNQQDSLNHIHSLALVPALEDKTSNGCRVIDIQSDEIQLLDCTEPGKYHICFEMQTQFGYLVLGIVPQGVIADFNSQGVNASSIDMTILERPAKNNKSDRQMVRDWIALHEDRVRNKGIVIYA